MNFESQHPRAMTGQFENKNGSPPDSILSVPTAEEKCAAIHSGAAHEEMLWTFSDDSTASVRAAVAVAAQDRDLLNKMSSDPSEWVRTCVAGNIATPDEILRQMRGSTARVTRAVLNNPNISSDSIDALADSVDSYDRRSAANHDKVTHSTLLRLAQDADEQVRVAVAEHQQAPRTALYWLAQSQSHQIISRVASNPATPLSLLQQLVKSGYVWQVDNNRAVGLLKSAAHRTDDEDAFLASLKAAKVAARSSPRR